MDSNVKLSPKPFYLENSLSLMLAFEVDVGAVLFQECRHHLDQSVHLSSWAVLLMLLEETKIASTSWPFAVRG